MSGLRLVTHRASTGISRARIPLGWALLALWGCQRAQATEPPPLRPNRPKAVASAAPPAPSAPAELPQASASASATSESTPESQAQTGCPSNMARLDAYCIDRYEAHLIEQLADGRELSHAHFQRPAAGARYLARSDSGEYPQAYISRVEAQRACEAGGKRLCTVSEWYGACRGSHDQPYPYGNRFINGRCNSSKAHLLSRFFGVNPRAWKYQDFNHPMLDQQPGFLAKSGEYSGCASELGVYDMVGNLHEWVSDTAGPSLTAKLPLRTGILRSLRRNRGHGIFMGGFFSTTSEFGRGCAFVTVGHEPDYHDYSTGFRCCADAPKG